MSKKQEATAAAIGGVVASKEFEDRLMVRDAKLPNPGSDEARNRGCICPVLDNNHGRWPTYEPDGWIYRMDCPLHSEPAAGE